MRKRFHRIKLWLTIHLVWSKFPALQAYTLRKFASTEADSAWQVQEVLKLHEAPAQRAELFEQVLEEYKHAELFKGLYTKQNESAYVPLTPERQRICKADDKLWQFHAYCVVGEKAALDQFENLAKVVPNADMRQVLRLVLRDEAGHVHGAQDLVAEFGIRAAAAAKEISRVKRRRFKEAWLRQGTSIADFLATILLSLAYFVIAPLGALSAKRRIYGSTTKSTTRSKPRPALKPSLLEA